MSLLNKIRDLVLQEWGDKIAKNHGKNALTIELRLTQAHLKEFNKDIMDLINGAFTIDLCGQGLQVETDKVHFITYSMHGLMNLRVIQETAAKSTAHLGGKSICISSH